MQSGNHRHPFGAYQHSARSLWSTRDIITFLPRHTWNLSTRKKDEHVHNKKGSGAFEKRGRTPTSPVLLLDHVLSNKARGFHV